MKKANITANYTIEREGVYSKFIYKKTPYSYQMAIPICVYSCLPALCLTILSQPVTLQYGIFIWFTLMLGLSLGAVFVINYFRKPDTFKVSKNSIIIEGKVFLLDHVSSIFILNPSGHHSESSMVVISRYYPLSLAGNIMGLNNQLENLTARNRMSIQNYIQENGYKIIMNYGTKQITVAKGIGEQEIGNLFDKIKEIVMEGRMSN
ncbi:MAG: hypothetical protein JWP67_3017 [Mucilaginibacter sp.]|nr:hypothetical protein [Mucilaginibacter sp.]